VWQERYGGRSDVLGKELKLNSRVFTIIGVLPKAAEFPATSRLWVPMQGDPNVNGSSYSYDGYARLKPWRHARTGQRRLDADTTRNL
jgi:hypothetical protein